MIAANNTRAELTDNGIGASTSANNGAIIVANFAPALQNPNVVPANIEGNKNVLPKKHKS